MFWNSVLSGLNVLTYWETYLAGLEYLAVFFIPMLIAGYLMQKNENAGTAIGCIGMLIIPIFQTAAMAVFVLTLAPIILGFGNDAAWSGPWTIMTIAPSVFLKLIGLLFLVALGVGFIPFLGHLESFQTLVLGGITLIFLLRFLESVDPDVSLASIHLYPGFWFTIGLLIISGIMSLIGMYVSALIGTILKEDYQEVFGTFVIFPVSAIFGFISVFIYGAWLGAQIRGGF